MKYVGVDLHEYSISVCVVRIVRGRREVATQRRSSNRQTSEIRGFFAGLGAFRAVVEATASYEWFFRLIEEFADRLVLAHPKKLRVIAESTHKTDKVDAKILATFLALDMIPEAYRPTRRVRQYRVLVRHRCRLQRRISSLKCKLRNTLAQYNADVAGLFTRPGQEYLAKLPLESEGRFVVRAWQEQLQVLGRQLSDADARLREFAATAPPAAVAEREGRAVLATIPQVGPVTIDVVLSELGEWRRLRSQKAVVAFAGLDPGVRQSAQKRQDLHITKEGSRLLRWAMIQAAWRLVGHSPRWRKTYGHLTSKTGSKKKAIVAVARRLLCVMFAVLRSGQAYHRVAYPQTPRQAVEGGVFQGMTGQMNEVE